MSEGEGESCTLASANYDQGQQQEGELASGLLTALECLNEQQTTEQQSAASQPTSWERRFYGLQQCSLSLYLASPLICVLCARAVAQRLSLGQRLVSGA